MSHRSALVICVSLIAVISAACGASDAEPKPSASEPTAWARPTPPGADSGVVYITRSSGLDDAIVSAEVSGDIAAGVVPGSATPGHNHSDGHIGHLDRPPETPGAATPTGDPVLLSGLKTPLAEGQHFPLRMKLSSGASVSVDVIVSANPTNG
jgi:copper(I)-binding protein